MSREKAITPRSEDFSAWYNDVIMRAQLADYSPVRGCMVIRPNGYRIWELIQSALDQKFKETGHQNAYFPLMIPESFLAREADHVEGFAPETAVVTRGGGKDLEEPLVLRPTSETIIYAMLAKWIQSYRDLPVLLNQWANVVRWEMRTRLFLRTTEFLWQEGHTAHATEAEAEEEAKLILSLYREFMEGWLAMPVLTGLKTESERFAGAIRTYGLEGLMQDNKALQAGTSHNLGQNFARAFDVTYQTQDGSLDYVWSTSWGVSTRLIGGLIMTHSDDTGLVCPPRVAPIQIAIVPIWRKDEERDTVYSVADQVAADLARLGLRVQLDRRDELKPGAKYYDWESKGVPIRLEIGPRDVASGEVVVAKRTGGKSSVPLNALEASLPQLLDQVQNTLFEMALSRREEASQRGISKTDFVDFMNGPGGFVYEGYCPECEEEIKQATKATVRVIPDEEYRSESPPTKCFWCGGEAKHEAVWARAY